MDILKQEECICAMATPAGGAIGIIRISGADSILLADNIFVAASKKPLAQALPNTVHYGEISGKNGETIDDVLVSVFKSPYSYTGENCVEISCHGSRYILQQVLQRLIEEGCRQAAPGEFTRRAYLNGKMDLSQAEAVADLIASTNKATHDMAMSQLKGHFSNELAVLREQLLKMNSLLELELDFSDHEELEFADRSELRSLALHIKQRITTLAHSFETGKAIKQGIPVAIIGKANVGKSTLLNRLLHEDRAIVSDIPGTTRDVIEDTATIEGVTFRFIDTAGIRKTEDKVEKIGIERTYKKMEEAKIIIYVKAPDCPLNEEDLELIENIPNDKSVIIVNNKIDILTSNPELSNYSADKNVRKVDLSAQNGYNFELLEKYLVELAGVPEITENDVIITSARHYAALLRANESISMVLDSMDAGMSGDLISEDLKIVLEELGQITGGQINSQETLNNIFKYFCIGK